MNKQDAKNAIEQDVIQGSSELFIIGYWSYVILPYDNSRGGTVLHYWPFENDVFYKEFIFTGKYFHKMASCGITNYNRVVPSEIDYRFYKLPKCKKCLKALNKIVDE